CHAIGTGGADNVPTSIGHGWQKGPRNSPTVFNAVFNAAQFWDGRASDLAAQAKGPVEASVEMNNTPEAVIATLSSIPQYVEAFERAYPGKDALSYDNMARALEAFQSTLVTPNSRSVQFLVGKETLNDTELTGLSLFINKGCVACHSGVNFGGQSYFPFGVVQRPGAEILPENDKGRFAVTNTASDEYVFRAAPLRNIALTAPYFHSGQVWDLEQAVAIMGSSQLGHTLEENEVGAITAFLQTLTGAVLAQWPGLGSRAGGGHRGIRSAGPRSGRERGRRHHRFPADPDRRAAESRVSHPAAEHEGHAQAQRRLSQRDCGPAASRFPVGCAARMSREWRFDAAHRW